MDLNRRERRFLEAIGAGATVDEAAVSTGYSVHWGKWKSRELRRRFNCETIREVVKMADDDAGVSRADFEKLTGLVSKLGESLEELARRPNDAGQQQQVRERELDVKDHAKALGLSLEDVERLKGEKEYEKWLRFEERRQSELAEADEDESENGTGEEKPKLLDGLGGIKNVIR